jgi:hypothetical protein
MSKRTREEKIGGVVVYQTRSGALELRGDVSRETLWASLDQIARVFERDKSVISRHIKNIFTEGELTRSSVVASFATTAADGKIYQVEYFNLDVIISVGYRVNSKKATQFRQWATKTLREHIVKGYTLNPKVVGRHYEEFQQAIADIRALLPAGATVDTKSVLELVSTFADTWLSLDAYDRDKLPAKGTTKRRVKLTAEKLSLALSSFRTELMRKGEATELFGLERAQGNIEGIVGNVMQAFGGTDLYPTLEEKAAHLLYFLVKNHPFTDGNKRSGAYAFVWFLQSAKLLDTTRITPPALTALTLLVAESNPKDKDKIIRLILALLAKKR